MTKTRIQKTQGVLKLVLTSLTGGSFVFVLFALFADPIVIGQGKFEGVIQSLESIDYRWWILGVSGFVFVLSMATTILFSVFDLSKIEIEQLRDSLYRLIKDKKMPVRVTVDEEIKVNLEKVIRAKFKIDTNLSLKETVNIKAKIPIDIELPIDTVVETRVLGLGSIKVPIKTKIPVSITFPFEGDVELDIKKLHLELNEFADVELPSIDVPIKCELDAILNLESNLRLVEEKMTEIVE